MDLIKCPCCGEMYSPSYRSCPFCEEEERPRRAAARRSGRHVSEKKRTHSARGPIAAVLLVVLVIFSWYLFGGSVMEKLRADDAPPAADSDVQTPATPDVSTPDGTGDGDAIVPTEPDDPTPPVVAEPDEPDEPDTTQTVDASQLTMKTSVGSLSKAPGTDSYDCSLGLSDTYIRLIVQGTDAQITWSSADSSVVTVGADGLLTPKSAGMTTVTASVGGAELTCIVRVKN